MPQTQRNPAGYHPGGESNNSQADTAALSSVPTAWLIRTKPNRTYPHALLLIVKCPYCGQEHTHGDGGKGDAGLGHRIAHCAPPTGTAYRRQRLERQQAEYEYVIDRIIDAHVRGELTTEELKKSIKTPLARFKDTTAKLQAINDRYPRRAGYIITRGPAGPTTQEAGPAQ